MEQKIDLQALRAIVEKATPGPWIRTVSRGYQETPRSPDHPVNTVCGSGPVHHEEPDLSKAIRDSEHIAALNPETAKALIDGFIEAEKFILYGSKCCVVSWGPLVEHSLKCRRCEILASLRKSFIFPGSGE